MSKAFVREMLARTPFTASVLSIILFAHPVSGSDEGKIQPIAYSHKLHIENVGLACVDCHANVETQASAKIPTLEVCKNCHSDQPVSDSPEEAKLLRYVAEGNEVPWRRIYTVPDHVYFSHRRHVVGGGIQCAVCHGNVAEFTQPVTSRFLPVTMENCMNCHKQSKVSNDCLACHR